MIKLQKRYILSSLTAGLSFIIFYVALDIYLYISVILSIFIYIAGIFIFKSQDLITYDSSSISKYYFEISKVNNYKDRIKDEIIINKLARIVNISTKIVNHLETKPKNATKIYTFLDYYLPFTDKIVYKYLESENKKDKTFVENKLILKMSVYIKEVERELEKLLEEIIKAKDKELDFEMKVFEKTSDIDITEDKGSD